MGNEEATLLSLRNVTERVHLRERLKMQSLTDELTGLYNRRGFIKLAESSISRANRKKTGMILFFIDMDKMKYINDNYGHNEGDEAIVAASSILRETFRNSDVIGRIGGDEFAVISTEAEANNIKTIENRLKSVQDKYNDNSEHKYKISLSVGGVYYNPEEPYTIDEWMIKADQLMYENKKKKIE